jgi:predicted Rdx family selenoprotein
MLRAAYFGQELLSTFNTSLGEIALIPATGGIFTIHLTYVPSASASDGTDAGGATAPASGTATATASSPQTIKEVLIWDRKTDGGFPEAKVLKQRIRDYIDPQRNLGHSDKPSSSSASAAVKAATATAEQEVSQSSDGHKDAKVCEDCA